MIKKTLLFISLLFAVGCEKSVQSTVNEITTECADSIFNALFLDSLTQGYEIDSLIDTSSIYIENLKIFKRDSIMPANYLFASELLGFGESFVSPNYPSFVYIIEILISDSNYDGIIFINSLTGNAESFEKIYSMPSTILSSCTQYDFNIEFKERFIEIDF